MNMMMGEPGQETVSLSELTREVTQDAYDGLVELAKTCPEKSDNDRKISLLKYINRTTQRLLRLNVLTKWCSQIPFVRTWQQLEGTLSSHELCFMQAADTLFFTHEGLHQASAPSYDVQTAMEVLATGNYVRLPKSIEDISIKSAFEGEEREEAFRKLNSLLRSKVLDANLPKEFSSVRTTDGKVIVEVKGEFKVHLTVGYRAHLSLWKILHLELLVGEKNGLLKLSDIQRLALGDDLERRMAAAEHPFMVLYSVLHEFCIALVMDTVIRQVRTLQQGRWKDAIRFELISDTISVQSGSISQTQVPSQDTDTDVGGMKTPGIKIMYWVDLVNSVGVVDSGCLPFLRIEPAHDQHISCTHNTYITDPLTDDEAKFTLDQSCIDVEGLLLRAISCNIHTRLVEVEKVLKGNNKLYQSEDDIILKHPGNLSKKTLIKISEFMGKATSESGEVEEEVLCLRTYGLCYVALGINIRNGRFTLRASRNLLLSSSITEDEDALNQGSRAPADVFISLRNKSILHLFASNGKFLGLKVYEKGVATAKIPKEAIRGSEMLLMGFPDCGNSYYLLIQLDTHFKPNFTLLKSQESNGRSGVVSGSLQFSGYLKIDVGELQMVEDEVNLSLLDNNLPPSKEDIILDATADKVAPTSYNSELVVQQGSSQSFSSVVDEIFNAEAGLSLQSAKRSNSTLMTEQSPLTGFQHTGKAGQPIPKRDGMLPASPNNILNKSSVGASMSPRLVNDLNNPNTRLGGLGSPPGGSATYGLNTSVSPSPLSPSFQRLSANPKNFSEQDPMIIDDDHQKKGMNSPKDGLSMYSPNRQTRGSSLLGTSPSQRSPILNSKPHFKGSPTGQPTSTLKGSATGMHMDSPTVQTSEGGATQGLLPSTPKQSATNRKRSLSDFINSMSSLQTTFTCGQIQKKRKITENHFSANSELDRFDECTGQLVGRTYDNILMEANSGKVPSTVYGTVLLQVVRHCSLFIKHARIVSQMDGLRMSYNEDVSLKKLSTDLWFRLPDSVEQPWRTIFLSLGKPGSMYWDVKVNDEHFRDLWELQKGKSGTSWGSDVRIANTSDADSHIRFCPEGVVLSYKTMEDVSVKQLLADLQRLSNARSFAINMKKLIEAKDERIDSGKDKGSLFKVPSSAKMGSGEGGEKVWEYTRKPFRIEAVGLMSLWFSYYGSMPGVIARFVVEWESGKEGCTMHVSPDQLWPHARFLEDFINGGEVAALLDCIRLTAGPLHALAGAIRPARMVGASTGITLVPPGFSVPSKTNGQTVSQVATQGSGSSPVISATAGGLSTVPITGGTSAHNVPIISNSGRGGGPGIVPSSLLPTDVSVVLRSPYWIRIIYRKNFAVDMRCFAGDQVWLQPGTPPMGGHSLGGSMPCPQFRPFIMEHVALGLNNFDAVSPHSGSPGSLSNNANISVSQGLPANATRMGTGSPGVSRPAMLTSTASTIFSRVSNASNVLGAQNLTAFNGGMPLAGRSMIPGAGMPVHVRGELNTAFIGLGDDGGYGGGWVPLLALKKVLRGILKYLGVLWLFSQLPELLTVTLGSILKENEGALLNLDPEQPALRFFVGSYVFAVSVHRIQLLLQVLSVKRFQQQQHQQQQNQINIQDELSSNEINEICDYFSRRVASEPYDASRVASFITLLTLPISVLREFLKLISWKRGTAQGQNSDIAPSQRPRVELCLENHRGSGSDTLASLESGDTTGGSVAKSNIHYDRPHNAVEFGLTVVLDPASIPHVNAAGGAAWLPYCVSVRLKYSFGENPQMYLLSMEGSHGGRACWPRTEDWERCRQKVAKAVEITGGSGASGSPVDISQGRLRVVAETLQLSLQTSLQQIRRTATPNSSSMPGSFSS